MKEVFLAPDRRFDVAPLTRKQFAQMTRDLVQSCALPDPEQDEAKFLLQLGVCHDAVTNAGSKQSPRELAHGMTRADVDSFFRQVLRITIRAMGRPAGAHCHSRFTRRCQ
jgi:hypothetical protein